MKSKTLDFFFKRCNTGEASVPNVENETNVQQHNSQVRNRNEDPTIEDNQPQKFARVDLGDNANPCDLERDPGLRKQIFEYHPNDRQNVIREYLKLKPFQPTLNAYPLSGPPGHLRSFQSTWFKKFTWLEYSPSKDATYCFPCFLFTKRTSGSFTHDGFRNWKKVNSGKDCAFLNHMDNNPNSLHNNNQKALEDLENTNEHIESALQNQSEEEIKKNRLRLKVSINAVRWLACQNCAFRGHDESIDSRNRGNFLELIKYTALYNDEVKKIVLENAPGNASYTSSTIQKEILQIFASQVQEEVRKEIGEAKFCVILDESQDRAEREQMAIVLRFVDEFGILKERFFDLVHVKNIASLTLQEELYKVLSYHNLNIKNIRDQGYDGASNMRGEFNGLKALILKDSPYAYYVHCFAHRLQLALVGATKEIIPIEQFFTKLAIIINMPGGSSKRREELHDYQQSEIADNIVNERIKTGRGLNQIFCDEDC